MSNALSSTIEFKTTELTSFFLKYFFEYRKLCMLGVAIRAQPLTIVVAFMIRADLYLVVTFENGNR